MVDLATKTKSRLNYAFMGLLILVAVGVLGWFFAVKPILAAQEKKRFEKAAASLQQLADEIQAKIGKADEVTKEESCGRAHLKNDRGPLLCDTGYMLAYNNKSVEEATRMMMDASVISVSPVRRGVGFDAQARDSDVMVFYLRQNGKTGQSFFQDLEDRNKLNCTAAYSHNIASSIHRFEIDISCGNKSLTEHFPLRN